ncbi:MAG: amidase domain-containing protein [Erysipelotrichaceae bacterium]|nr:amidase domain-containing protein [Erysipelotrichaceae bacterium]
MKKKKKKLRFRKEFISLVKKAAFLLVIFVLLRTPFLISINGDKNIIVEAGSEYLDPGATGKFGIEVKTDNKVNTAVPGTYKVVYSWLAESAARKVKVVDTTSPSISLADGNEVYLLKGEETNLSVSAFDSIDGDLTDKINVKGKYDITTTGDYEITYSVADKSGNKDEKKQIVHVVDGNIDYCGLVSNKAGVSSSIIAALKQFYNHYFTSIRFLKKVDFSSDFSNSRELERWNAAMDILLYARTSSTINLRMRNCLYELTITSIDQTAEGYEVEVLERSVFEFAFMEEGEHSEASEIYNLFVFDSSNKIIGLYKEEGFYMVFHELNSSDSIERAKQTYLNVIEENAIHNKEVLNRINEGTMKFETAKTVITAYDREKAVEYADEYALKRNSDYFAFNSNCVNFVSQCMHVGGIPMVYSGDYQWKYYSFGYNPYSGKTGYTYSWTYIPAYTTMIENSNKVIVEPHQEVYFSEPGDCIMLSRDGEIWNHVVLCTKVVRNQQGEIVEVLYSGNTNDVKNYPLSATVYWMAECEKILGSR